MNVDLPATIFAERLAITLLIGILVGLERAWAHKFVGLRTFAIVAVLGLLGSLLGTAFALTSILGTFLLVAYVNARSLIVDRSLEIKTSAALIVVVTLGALVGHGQVFVPIASAIVVTICWPGRSKSSVLRPAFTPRKFEARCCSGC